MVHGIEEDTHIYACTHHRNNIYTHILPLWALPRDKVDSSSDQRDHCMCLILKFRKE